MTNKIKLNILQKFLIWSAGANQEILSREICLTERYKYESIGTTVVLTSIMALLSGGYALFTVFGSVPIAIALGSFWSVIIFNLDRFFLLTASRRKSESQWRFYLVSVPIRLGIAVSLSFVIAKPLELRLFEIEINQEIERVNNKNKVETEKSRQEIVKSAPETKEIEEIKVEIAKLNERRAKLADENKDAILEGGKEYDGKGRTATPGDGSVRQSYKKIEDSSDNEIKKIDEQLKSLDIKKKELTQKREENLSKLLSQKTGTEKQVGGVLAQISALERLSESDPAVKATNQLIVLLFIIIEISPILVKMLASSGLYEELVMQEDNERTIQDNIDKMARKKTLTLEKVQDFNSKVEEILRNSVRTKEINREEIENMANIRIDDRKRMRQRHDEADAEFHRLCDELKRIYKDSIYQVLSLGTDENIFRDSTNIQKDIDIR